MRNHDALFACRTIGLRSIQLLQDPVQLSQENKNTVAESFYFRLNGNAIYSRGTNVVPLSLLKSNVNKETMEKLLWSVKAAGMNMIRVWGGGRYFNDYFYHLCDKMAGDDVFLCFISKRYEFYTLCC